MGLTCKHMDDSFSLFMCSNEISFILIALKPLKQVHLRADTTDIVYSLLPLNLHWKGPPSPHLKPKEASCCSNSWPKCSLCQTPILVINIHFLQYLSHICPKLNLHWSFDIILTLEWLCHLFFFLHCSKSALFWVLNPLSHKYLVLTLCRCGWARHAWHRVHKSNPLYRLSRGIHFISTLFSSSFKHLSMCCHHTERWVRDYCLPTIQIDVTWICCHLEHSWAKV